jgi:hypothetical protein
MVYVRLAQQWVDGAGGDHAAGEMVDVDAGTLAELESQGIVTAPAEEDAGTDPVKDGPDKAWAGPGAPPRP